MDYAKGYSTAYRVTRLNDDWTDGERVERVRSLSITRDCTDDVSLLEQATMEADGFDGGWCRIDAIMRQAGETVLEHLGCFRFEASGITVGKGISSGSYDGYSVLKPADEVAMEVGSYAPKGADGAAYVAELLSVCPSPVDVVGSFILTDHIVYSDGTTRMGAAWQVLQAYGWCIMLGGDGLISIMEQPSEPIADIMRRQIAPGVSISGNQATYTRAHIPSVRPQSIVRHASPSIQLDGLGRVVSQGLTLGKSISVEEVVEWTWT